MNCIGALLFLLPFCVFLLGASLQFVAAGMGSVAMQELVTYMHASLFMLRRSHSSVAVMCGWIFFTAGSPPGPRLGELHWRPAVPAAFLRLPAGRQAVFLLKTLIPLLAVNLMLQGTAEILRNLLFLIEDSD